MTTSFPTGPQIDPQRTRLVEDNGYDLTITSQGRPKMQKRRKRSFVAEVTYHGVTQADRDTVRTFLQNNRAADDIGIILYDVIAIGSIVGEVDFTRVTADNYEIQLTLNSDDVQAYGLVWLAATGTWNDFGIWLDTGLWDEGSEWLLATGNFDDAGKWDDTGLWRDS